MRQSGVSSSRMVRRKKVEWQRRRGSRTEPRVVAYCTRARLLIRYGTRNASIGCCVEFCMIDSGQSRWRERKVYRTCKTASSLQIGSLPISILRAPHVHEGCAPQTMNHGILLQSLNLLLPSFDFLDAYRSCNASIFLFTPSHCGLWEHSRRQFSLHISVSILAFSHLLKM